MRQRLLRFAVVSALTVVGLACLPGCAPQLSGPSLVLRLASPDNQLADTAPAIERFAADVDRLSQGTIEIEPVWATSPIPPDVEVKLAQSVGDGSYELGYVPGRAFDLLGVTTLRALNAPFLITSTFALAAVLDTTLRADLMAGLPEAGFVGLDLHPGGLRHPFGVGGPLLAPEDYVGAQIWAAPSLTVAAYLEGLGAVVTNDVRTPGLRGAEAQYSRAKGRAATGNVTFFPKTNVLFAGAALRDRLRSDQWEVLVDAAAETRRWLVAEQPSDFESAAAFCDQVGGRIYTASDEDVAALEAAAAPVITKLRKDPETSRIIDGILDVVAGATTADPVTTCPGGAGDPTELDGRYRQRVTAHDLRAAGVTDPADVHENSGVFTWTLDAGVFSWRTKPKRLPVDNPVASGRYTWEQGYLTMHWSDGTGSTTMKVKIHPDGSLSFSDIQDANPAQQELSEGFFKSPWRWLGDLPS